MKQLGSAAAASAWIVVCLYLYAWWPSLAAALGLRFPRTAWLALCLAALVGLRAKDRWLRAPTALVVDALAAAPPLLAIAFFFHPFVVPLE